MPEPQNVYDRPGDVRSIPRDGRPRDTDEPELNWERNDIPSRPPMESRSIPRDGTPQDDEDFGYPRDSDSVDEWYEEEPFETPNVSKPEVRSKMPEDFDEEPEYDWSSDKPEDAEWKKEEPEYDW